MLGVKLATYVLHKWWKSAASKMYTLSSLMLLYFYLINPLNARFGLHLIQMDYFDFVLLLFLLKYRIKILSSSGNTDCDESNIHTYLQSLVIITVYSVRSFIVCVWMMIRLLLFVFMIFRLSINNKIIHLNWYACYSTLYSVLHENIHKSRSLLVGPLWLFDDLLTSFFLSAVCLLVYLSRESGLQCRWKRKTVWSIPAIWPATQTRV